MTPQPWRILCFFAMAGVAFLAVSLVDDGRETHPALAAQTSATVAPRFFVPETPTRTPVPCIPFPSSTPTVTPTQTLTAPPVPTGSPTATQSPQTTPTAPTGNSSRHVSAAAAGECIGGRSFAISSDGGGVHLRWGGGNVQTGYVLQSMALGAGDPLVETQLGATDTSFDVVAPPGLNCYLLRPQGASTDVRSDLQCAVVGFRTSSGAPQGLAMALNQSNRASFAWTPALLPGQNGYVLATIPPPEIVASIGLGATGMMAPPVNGFTCYVLATLVDGAVAGYTDQLCGVPGFSILTP